MRRTQPPRAVSNSTAPTDRRHRHCLDVVAVGPCQHHRLIITIAPCQAPAAIARDRPALRRELCSTWVSALAAAIDDHIQVRCEVAAHHDLGQADWVARRHPRALPFRPQVLSGRCCGPALPLSCPRTHHPTRCIAVSPTGGTPTRHRVWSIRNETPTHATRSMLTPSPPYRSASQAKPRKISPVPAPSWHASTNLRRLQLLRAKIAAETQADHELRSMHQPPLSCHRLRCAQHPLSCAALSNRARAAGCPSVLWCTR